MGEVGGQQLKVGVELIRMMSAPFELAQFTDRYQDALLGMTKSKIAGEEPVLVQSERNAEVIDLMEALTQSVAKTRAPAGKKPAAKSICTRARTLKKGA